MGERGPAPTPTRLRVLHGETKPSRVNADEPQPRDVEPEPPEWLPKRAREVWDRVLVELRHMRMATAADQDALVVYCQAVAHYEEACRLVNVTGMLVRGQHGESVKNPAMQFVRDQALLVKAMAQQFGLTPAARVGLKSGGQPFGLGAERLLS